MEIAGTIRKGQTLKGIYSGDYIILRNMKKKFVFDEKCKYVLSEEEGLNRVSRKQILSYAKIGSGLVFSMLVNKKGEVYEMRLTL